MRAFLAEQNIENKLEFVGTTHIHIREFASGLACKCIEDDVLHGCECVQNLYLSLPPSEKHDKRHTFTNICMLPPFQQKS